MMKTERKLARTARAAVANSLPGSMPRSANGLRTSSAVQITGGRAPNQRMSGGNQLAITSARETRKMMEASASRLLPENLAGGLASSEAVVAALLPMRAMARPMPPPAAPAAQVAYSE